MSEAARSDPPKAATANRLSIGHLMLWTLCFALVLGGYRLLLERQLPGVPLEMFLVFIAVFSFPVGAQVAGCILWGYRAWTRIGGFPVQPGHWLLAVEGATAGGALASQLAGIAAGVEFTGEAKVVPLMLVIARPVLGTTGYAYCLSQLPEEGRWWRNAITFLMAQRILGLLSLSLWIPLTYYEPTEMGAAVINMVALGNSTDTWCCLGLINAVYVALVANFDPLRRQRDFLHWTGIVALITAAIADFSVLRL